MATSLAIRRATASSLFNRLVNPLRSVSVVRSFNTNTQMKPYDQDDRDVDVERRSDRSVSRRRDAFPSLFSDVFDPFSPPRSVSQLLNMMDQMMDSPFVASPRSMGTGVGVKRGWDLREDDNALYIKMDMPGVDKENVKVAVEENTLIIKGEGDKESEDEEYRRRYSTNLSFFLICFLFFTQFSSISCEEKVSLALYYESLCPYCSNFIVNYLPKIFKNGMIDIVDLKLVPWGNTKLQPNNTFKCQHGEAECFLDIVEACAIDAWPDLNEHFPFIYCVESLVYHKNYTQWETCFEKLNLKKKLVTDCVVSGRGKELELQYAAETNALQPPHKYVPWVVVDGQPLYDDYLDFISYICKAYKGTAPVPSCSSSFNVLKMGRKFNPFCLKQTVISKLSTISSAITSWLNRGKLTASA